jgi:hypothetical protein
VPAVTVATTAPAFAASGDDVVVADFAVTASCYSATVRGQAMQRLVRFNFAISDTLPAGTRFVHTTTAGGVIYNETMQTSGLTYLGRSSDPATGMWITTDELPVASSAVTRIIVDFFVLRNTYPWSTSLSIVLPSGYVASPGSILTAQVGETAAGQISCQD